jgi:tektin-4
MNAETNKQICAPSICHCRQSTPEGWDHYTKENLSLLEAERKRSVDLRHSLNGYVSDAARDLRVQADRVDTALAIRIAETDEVRQRMENELLKVWHRKVIGSSYLTILY